MKITPNFDDLLYIESLPKESVTIAYLIAAGWLNKAVVGFSQGILLTFGDQLTSSTFPQAA